MTTQTVHFKSAPFGSLVLFTAQTKNAFRFASSELGLAEYQWHGPTTFAVEKDDAHTMWTALEEAGWVVVPGLSQ
jgi:hypothetical protein